MIVMRRCVYVRIGWIGRMHGGLLIVVVDLEEDPRISGYARGEAIAVGFALVLSGYEPVVLRYQTQDGA